MKYTDPSGEHPVVVAMIIAAAVSATMYTVNCVINNQAITLQGFMGSAITGAISGAFTFGIGTATSTIANFYVRAAVQAVAHGTFQGGMSEAQGGTFAQGFYSGSLSSLAASAFSGGQHLGSDGTPLECTGWGGAGKFAKNDFGMIAFGTVSGGLGAELAGGNFWQGAATGAIVSSLNHYLHKKGSMIEQLKKAKINPKGKPLQTEDYVNQFVDDVEVLNNSREYAKNQNGEAPRIIVDSGNHYGEYKEGTHTLTVMPRAFKNNLTLAYTLLHEYRHAWYHVSGQYAAWNIMYPGQARNISEVYAYTREQNWGNLNVQSDIDYYRALTKGIDIKFR